MTVLYIADDSEVGALRDWQSSVRSSGVAFELLSDDMSTPPSNGGPNGESNPEVDAARRATINPPLVEALLCVRQSYRTYRWLRARESNFDLVVLHDWKGSGFHALVGCSRHSVIELPSLVLSLAIGKELGR